MFDFFHKRRRQRLRSTPFPDAWAEILRENLPPYRHLGAEDREELHQRIQVFLADTQFEGCGGLVLTDQVRLTIAAQACLLLLRRPPDEGFGHLVTVLVYPSAYLAHGVEPIGGGLFIEGDSARLGQASRDGVVILSWDDVRAGAADFRDGHNVVLHEFAHQLDQADGVSDGTPPLERRSRYLAWARVLSAEYERLQAGRPSELDRYGGINPAEFFAVATECYFERPLAMKSHHPDLFRELREYYGVDPSDFQAGRA